MSLAVISLLVAWGALWNALAIYWLRRARDADARFDALMCSWLASRDAAQRREHGARRVESMVRDTLSQAQKAAMLAEMTDYSQRAKFVHGYDARTH